MKQYAVSVPPRAPAKERYAILEYEGEIFELPYTLVHLMAGWISSGGDGYMYPKVVENAGSVFRHIASAMHWDNAPPPEDEHTAMLRRVGYGVWRHEFKLPNPELAVYAEGHEPKPGPEQVFQADLYKKAALLAFTALDQASYLLTDLEREERRAYNAKLREILTEAKRVFEEATSSK